MHRLRMIAGPNGSGKTTLTNFLRNTFDFEFGYYINADDIEALLSINGKISFRRFGLSIAKDSFHVFFNRHPLKRSCEGIRFDVARNTFYLKTQPRHFSYFAALFADFLRQQLLNGQQTFSFETVMSGKDKIALFHKAKEMGYRTYLYYICTDDVLINQDRVANRTGKGGHPVPEKKIKERYYRSLEHLLEVIKLSDRAYMFDNSGIEHKLFAEITGGELVKMNRDFVPHWFQKYVLQKSV